MEKARKSGRPCKAGPVKRSLLLQVRCTAQQLKTWQRAASREGLDLSGWVRSRLVKAADAEQVTNHRAR